MRPVFRRDPEPLVPGEPAELKFCMWPTSILLRRGHQIRVALAGADSAAFRRYPPTGDVTWTIHPQIAMASYVELPRRSRMAAMIGSPVDATCLS